MTTASRPQAGAASFAHLIAPTRAAAARAAEETDDERKEREDDERARNERETGHAETDDEREQREEKERDEDAKRSRRAAEDGDEDEDGDKEEMKKAAKAGHAKALAAAERQALRRVAHILGSRHAANNVALAAKLAVQRNIPAHAAIDILSATPSVRHHADRAGRNPAIGSGTRGGPAGAGTQVQGMWDAAFARVGGRPKHASRG